MRRAAPPRIAPLQHRFQSSRNTARAIAALVVLQGVAGWFMNFRLLRPVFSGAGFLEQAALHAQNVGLAALIALALGAMSVGVAIAAWPIFRLHSRAMASWVLVLATLSFALSAVEAVGNMSLLSLSKAFVAADGADAALFETLRGVVAAPRNFAHFIGMMLAGSFYCVFYTTLLRFALVPRVLAAAGVLAALMQIVAVGLPLFGHPVNFALIAPMGLAHLALVLWLSVKGFKSRELPHNTQVQ